MQLREDNYQLVSSKDGKTWKVELKADVSFWTIREARDRSGKDRETYYRVLAMHFDGKPLITYRAGMSVYDVP